MHILEIVSFLPPYGGYFAIEQAAALQQAGNRVGMLYCQQLGVSIDRLDYFTKRYDRWEWTAHQANQDIHIYQTNFRGVPRNVRYNQQRYCTIICDMFDAYVKKNGMPDVLHAQAAKWAGIAAMQISQRTGIPYFVTEHFSPGSYEIDFGKGWTLNTWAKNLIRQCYDSARCVIPVAEELVDSTSCYFGKDYRYYAVSNITDVDFFIYKGREPLEHRPFRFCCLAISNKGEFYRKGYDVLAKAIRGINNFELHIAGRDTATQYFKQLFEEYYGAPLPNNVIIHGNLSREEIRNLLYQMDALVLASRSEVQPLVVLEALSTGIPVVGTEVIPQSERIKDAVLIAETGNDESLHKKMQEVRNIQPSPLFHEKVAEISSPENVSRQLMSIFTTFGK